MKNIFIILAGILFIVDISLAQDTLYIYKNGTVVTQRAIVDIDSIIFYKPAILSNGCGSTTSVTDIDGNIYNAITIGSQCWMEADLKVSKYRDGSLIPNITDNTQWTGLTSGAWCYYNNNNSYSSVYGKIYNFYTIADSKNLCPLGWHVPSDAEWTVLINYLGGFSTAGDKMKETGTTHWFSPSSSDNSSGFTALPGGNRVSNGSFYFMGSSGLWWTSTEYDPTSVWEYNLSNTGGQVGRNHPTNNKNAGRYVRCIKD